METRRIRLREVTKEDLPTIFEWRNTEKFRFLFHHNENIINYDEFCEEFICDMTVRKFQYIIETTTTCKLVGLTFIHSFSEVENYCFFNVFFDERYEGKGYGVDAFALFSYFLFNSAGIKKIYVEAFEYNIRSLSFIRKSGMKEIEVLRNKKLHLEKEYDILRFSCDNSLLPTIIALKEKLSLPKSHL